MIGKVFHSKEIMTSAPQIIPADWRLPSSASPLTLATSIPIVRNKCVLLCDYRCGYKTAVSSALEGIIFIISLMSSIKRLTFIFNCVSVCACTCMCVCLCICACSSCRGQKKASATEAVVRSDCELSDMGSGNWTLVLYKSSAHLLSPFIYLYKTGFYSAAQAGLKLMMVFLPQPAGVLEFVKAPNPALRTMGMSYGLF